MDMIEYREHPLFQDRADAGRRLADKLTRYEGSETVVFALPRGGVPVAIEIAGRLRCHLDLIVVRKIPIPGNPEAGCGAVTEDGGIVLNQLLIEEMGLNEREIQVQADAVRAEVVRRSALFRSKLAAPDPAGKTAIICDDGLASGYTMIAAIKSAQKRGAAAIVVAVPVASRRACDLVKPLAERVVALIVAPGPWFAVANYYEHWYDLTDDEVVKYLDDWQADTRGRRSE